MAEIIYCLLILLYLPVLAKTLTLPLQQLHLKFVVPFIVSNHVSQTVHLHELSVYLGLPASHSGLYLLQTPLQLILQSHSLFLVLDHITYADLRIYSCYYHSLHVGCVLL